jgi:CheY-like chemotaxis protein
MANKQKNILLVSSTKLFDALSSLLTQSGFKVTTCLDGAQALEIALKQEPEIMVVDTGITVLGADKLVQILRSNAKTELSSIFFVGPEGEQIEGFRRQVDRYIPRPFNNEQLLAEILTHFNRREKSQQLGQARTEVEGDLKQISLPDLLQIFSLNRKDGVLALSHDKQKGYVHLLEGQVVSARLGRIVAEKAFFRMLLWDYGKFRFTPGNPQTEKHIDTATDQLLLEGMRQNDEMLAQMATFPASDKLLELAVPTEHLPKGLRPGTLEIIELLDGETHVSHIVDNSSRSDYEVLQVLRALLEKGLLKESHAGEGETETNGLLMRDEEIVAIKDFFGEGDALLEETSAKLIILAEEDRQAEAFLLSLQGVDEFEPESDFLEGGGGLTLGDIGRLEISDKFHLRLFLLPASEESAPFWRPFCHRLFGVLSLAGDASLQKAENYFFETAHVPVAKYRDLETFNGILPLRRGDRQGVRKLLQFFAVRFTGHENEESLI